MAGPGKKPERLPGPSMLAFWEDVLEPLIDSLQPETLLKIGSDQGGTTRALLEYAQAHGAKLHAIDPKPHFDVGELRRMYPDALDFQIGLSLEILPDSSPSSSPSSTATTTGTRSSTSCGCWSARRSTPRRSRPVVALHDIGWPYGRRDLYYDPENIPADKRRPFARRAIHPDHDELVEEGINGHLANAEQPAAEHSGVLGAIEDFIAESDLEWTLFEILGEHGLGVLAPAEVLEERGKTAELLESTGEPKFLRRRLEAVERARIDTEIRRVRAKALADAKQDARPTGGESGRARRRPASAGPGAGRTRRRRAPAGPSQAPARRRRRARTGPRRRS